MIDLEAIRARVEARRLSAPSRRRLRPEERDCDKLLAYADELREAAREMDCYWCRGSGKFLGTDRDCDRCADLRRLLGESHE